MDTLPYRVPRDDTGEGLRNGPPMLHALLRHRAQKRDAGEVHGRDYEAEGRYHGHGALNTAQQRGHPRPQRQAGRRQQRQW